jgi:hypothetical protein
MSCQPELVEGGKVEITSASTISTRDYPFSERKNKAFIKFQIKNLKSKIPFIFAHQIF